MNHPAIPEGVEATLAMTDQIGEWVAVLENRIEEAGTHPWRAKKLQEIIAFLQRSRASGDVLERLANAATCTFPACNHMQLYDCFKEGVTVEEIEKRYGPGSAWEERASRSGFVAAALRDIRVLLAALRLRTSQPEGEGDGVLEWKAAAEYLDWLEREGHSLMYYGPKRWDCGWGTQPSPRDAIRNAMADKEEWTAPLHAPTTSPSQGGEVEGWRDTFDQMPPDGAWVLACFGQRGDLYDGGRPRVVSHRHGNWSDGTASLVQPAYWMPLPASPAPSGSE